MKKNITTFVFTSLGILMLQAQKKANGKVYVEHPAIDVVNTFTKAMVAGDTVKLASLLSEDFKAFSGLSSKAGDKGTEKADYIKNARRWHDELDYFSMDALPGSYPDAIEYKEEDQKDVVWVQTWDLIKGVHKTTGVKLSSAAHRLFVVDENEKIKTLINYTNESLIDELRASFSDRSNGTIYNHHDNINTIRKMIYAYENGDLDASMGFYSEDSRFYNLESEGWEDFATPVEMREEREKLLKDFEIKSIDIVGYPDYLEYEMGNGRSVLSWWNFILVRKSDKKEITLFVHLSDHFDAEGHIIYEYAYFNRALLEK